MGIWHCIYIKKFAQPPVGSRPVAHVCCTLANARSDSLVIVLGGMRAQAVLRTGTHRAVTGSGLLAYQSKVRSTKLYRLVTEYICTYVFC